MVIVRLLGGLGNQMFQYAAGRRLAFKHGVSLKLDVTALGAEPGRDFALGEFATSAEVASDVEVDALARGLARMRISRIFGNGRTRTHVEERQFQFDPAILELRPPVYLSGYWQTEKYFADIEEVIRSDLTVKSRAEGQNAALLQRIASVNSVSVHVRRGDYVSNPHTNRFHGVCSLEYYRAAIAEVRSRVSDPHFFIFSDDPEWARKNIVIPARAVVIDHNGLAPCEDLRLMTRCRHHIIANSTFSWWGAWLASTRDQVVVAPRQWFASDPGRARDLCPTRWVRM